MGGNIVGSVLLAIGAPLIARQDPYRTEISQYRKGPNAERILGNGGNDWIEVGTFDGAPGDDVCQRIKTNKNVLDLQVVQL